MADAKKVNTMPATEEGDNMPRFMGAGVHLVKVHEMLEGISPKDGTPITDKNGNPSIRIIFINKAKETIDSLYFFSELPVDDPGRNDESKICKSEWRLKELKATMGLPVTKTATIAQVKEKKLWVAVKLVETFNSDGEHVLNDKGKKKAYHEIFQIAPYDPDGPTKGRPAIEGDPQTDPNHFQNSKFYEQKLDRAASPNQTSQAKPATAEPGNAPAPADGDDF